VRSVDHGTIRSAVWY